MTNINQYKQVGKTLAELVHYSLAWEEPLNGDNIEDIVSYFKEELQELNAL
jgi:hypothetical protein